MSRQINALCMGAGFAMLGAVVHADEPAGVGTDFRVNAGVAVAEEYTTNVFSTATDERDDFVTIIEPRVDLAVRSETARVTASASAEIGLHAEFEDEDYEDFQIKADGEFPVSDDAFLFGGGALAWEHEDRTSPDDARGAKPVEYLESTAYAGVGLENDDYFARIGANLRDLDFDDVPAAGGGSIDQDDRDRLHTELGGRLGVKLSESDSVFVQAIYDRRDYEDALDGDDFARDSQGAQFAVGWKGELGPVAGEVLAGVLIQDYEDPAFDTVVTPDIGADLTWRAGPNTRLSAVVSRSLEETTVSGASTAVDTTAGLRLRRAVAPDLSFGAYAFFTHSDYRESSRRDKLTEAGFSLRKYLISNIYVDAEYSYRMRDSNVAVADFDDHSILLRLGAQLRPRYQPDMALAEDLGGEAYVGVQGGVNTLLTRVNGDRGDEGSIDAEFGDDGLEGGVFAGYRRQFGDMVLGVEAEAALDNADWRHDGARDFGVKRRNGYGVSAIAGVKTRNDVLIYGRAGVESAKLERDYQKGNSTAVAMDSAREVGVRAGVGVEFPVSGPLSARMEYVIGDLAGFRLAAPQEKNGPDSFSPHDSTVRLGLLWRFGGEETKDAEPFNFEGPYVGAQIGHDVLMSRNSGPRPDVTDTNFILDAQRGGDGFSASVMGGYGVTMGNVYLGVEGEAGYSTASWDIDRDPTGRVVSLEKGFTLGAGLRAGYIVNDAVLVYGRVGVTASELKTDYAFRDVSIQEKDFETGLQFGGGVEVGISDATSIRLEYLRTKYDSDMIDYGAGVDRISRAENQFRFGLLHRF